MKTSLALLAVAALAALSPVQRIPDDYKALNEYALGDQLTHPEWCDGLMVAIAVGPSVWRWLPSRIWLVTQPMRVVDSRAFAAGTVVDVYYRQFNPGYGEVPTPGSAVVPGGVVPIGSRVLLVGRKAEGGLLRVPSIVRFGGPDRPPVAVDPAVPAVLQIAVRATAATHLSDDPDPKWRLLGSLAAAIPGTGDANAKEIAESVESLPLRGRHSGGRGDDRLSRLFADAVRNDTAYHRALVDLALNQLQYLGYERRWARDLNAAAEDPNAFPDGLPAPSLMFHEDAALYSSGWPKDYKPAPPTSDEEDWAALLRARSPTIAAAFLKDIATKPSDDRVRALAVKFLAFPDPRARWAMVERLAWWNGHPAPDKPMRVMDSLLGVERTDYPGLEEAVAYWRAKLGV